MSGLSSKARPHFAPAVIPNERKTPVILSAAKNPRISPLPLPVLPRTQPSVRLDQGAAQWRDPRISPLPLRLLVTLTYHPFERNEPKFPKSRLHGNLTAWAIVKVIIRPRLGLRGIATLATKGDTHRSTLALTLAAPLVA